MSPLLHSYRKAEISAHLPWDSTEGEGNTLTKIWNETKESLFAKVLLLAVHLQLACKKVLELRESQKDVQNIIEKWQKAFSWFPELYASDWNTFGYNMQRLDRAIKPSYYALTVATASESWHAISALKVFQLAFFWLE